MADTIINSRRGQTGSDVTDSAVGWVIAAIVILALAIGFIALFRHNAATTPGTPNTGAPTQINNTGTGGTGGATTPGGTGGASTPSTGGPGSTGGTTGGTSGSSGMTQ